MTEGPKATGVSYKSKNAEYFEKRGLKRYAGVWSPWALSVGVGSVIAYVMQRASFVLLRKNHPGIERPYRSPLGNAGAWIAGIISFITLIFLFLNPEYRLGVIGCAVWFLAGLVYFAIHARHHMVLSPEEEFVLSQSEKS